MIAREPLCELVFIFDLNQVHGVLLVDLGHGKGMRRGGGIGGIDPIDERLLVPKDQGCSMSMIVAPESSCAGRGAPCSCRAGMVLVDQPTEDLAPRGPHGPRRPRSGHWAPDILRAAKTEPAMRSMRVVMRGVLTQDLRQVSSTQDQHVIEHLPPHASDRSLDVAVGLWGPVRSEHDLDGFGAEDGIEAAAVLRVAVAEQEPHG